MNIPLGTLPPASAGASAVRSKSPAEASGPKEAPSPETKAHAAAEPSPAPLSAEAVQKVAQQINEFLKSAASNLQFSVDANSKEVVVRVVDEETKEVIRQIPSEEMVAMSKAMDRMAGLLIQQKV